MSQYFLRDTWYICMDDLSFQEPKVYPRSLLISLHGDLKPTSQARQHMYHCTYFKVMYIHNDSQGLIHELGACEKIFWHINIKELMAAFLALQLLVPNHRNGHVQLSLVNTTAVAHLNHLGGTK